MLSSLLRKTDNLEFQLDRRVSDMGLLAVLLIFAAIGATSGYDAALLVSGDALFPVQFWDFPPLEFRPPPSSNLFPDLLLHGVVRFAVSDPVSQKLIVGILVFIVSACVIGAYFGATALLAFLALYAVSGFGFVDSTAHFSLPFMLVVQRLAAGRRSELPVLFVLVFSDLLFLFPLAVLVLLQPMRTSLPRQIMVVSGAIACNILYAEFSVAAVQFTIVFPAFLVVALVARRLGGLRLFTIGLCFSLPLMSIFEIAPARYTIPVATALFLTLPPLRTPVLEWRGLIAPAVVVAMLVVTLDWNRFDRLRYGFACLADTLSARGIGVVAADHWSAKPLYMSVRERARPLTITQIDFDEGDIHPWMAPYSFHGAPTRYAIRYNEQCAIVGGEAKYCGQERIAPIDTVEQLCGGFDLFRYTRTVPLKNEMPPANKIESIHRNLANYVEKAVALWNRMTARHLQGNGGNRRYAGASGLAR